MKQVKGIILCEGETDQVLISSYLGKVRGWTYSRYKNSPFPDDPVEWFKNELGEVLGIWPVGGSSFSEPIKKILIRERYEPTVEAIVVVTDHDDSSVENDRLNNMLDAINTAIAVEGSHEAICPNQWYRFKVPGDFCEGEVRIGYLLVPLGEIGALETFMLDALSESSPEKERVIEQSRSFVQGFESDVYLRKRRERTKAELGVALAVFSPDKVFSTMKELIDSVDWSEFATTDKQFKLLTEI